MLLQCLFSLIAIVEMGIVFFKVQKNPLFKANVPNAFRPEGINDRFEVYGPGIEGFELEIYNRWGQRVYSTDDIRESWNGRRNGELMPEGVYVYVIRARGADGKRLDKKGTLTLIR